MSDSVQPHGLQPTRLLHPWDSPGKNTGVGCHFLLQCMKVESDSEVAQSCPTLSDPKDCSLPGSSIHGIFQARVLEWGAIAFSPKHPLASHYLVKHLFCLALPPIWYHAGYLLPRKPHPHMPIPGLKYQMPSPNPIKWLHRQSNGLSVQKYIPLTLRENLYNLGWNFHGINI